MKFVVLGVSELTIRCSTALLDVGADICSVVSMPQHMRPNNSADLNRFAQRHNIAYHEVEDINSQESVKLIRGYSPDYVFCTWPKIMKTEVLQTPRQYCIGTHPTELPHDRGRHSLHWLIALGVSETKMSFFRMDERVDTGDLLLQVPYQITANDTIESVVSKVNSAAYEGILALHEQLLDDPLYVEIRQDHTLANYWRKRTPHDVTLDLRMSASMILRTVRSFGPPYPCANLIFEDSIIKISHASVAKLTSQIEPDQLRRIEPGKVLLIEGNSIMVKVDDAILDLKCATAIPQRLLKAKYIHPPTRYVTKWPELLAFA